jgi:hypothetical protein
LFPALSQQFALGVKGGIQTSDDVRGFSVQSSESKRYIIGPMLELRLPWRLGIEFDALYRRLGYTSQSGGCCASAIHRERANSWEFPLIVKYRLPARLARPFAGVGYDPRTVHGSDVSSGSYLSGITTNPPASIYTYYFNRRISTDYRVTHGLVICGGVDLDAKHIRISPELRYVRWNTPFLDQVGGDGSYFIQSAQNELSILVGISWR